ncbi:MAG: pyridoxal phosphate-dependent aminotransferase [Bacilli bacterium]|nr:pyridoxal phosphate-dependent aminotransferase [Bacilli bacterium]
MIEDHYKYFRVRDYLEDTIETGSNSIDCTLGVNPFIEENYTDPKYNHLKQKLIQSIYEDTQVLLRKDELSFSSGTMGIIRTICTILLNEGDICIGSAPQFTRFSSEVELQKAEYLPLHCTSDDKKFNTQAFMEFLEDNMALGRPVKLIYLDNPNNPTGQVIPIQELTEIVKLAEFYHIYVLVDEAYGDYMDQSDSAINLMGMYKNVIIAKSASKAYGLPNDRIGYVIANKELIEVFDQVQLPFPFSEESMNKFIKALSNKKHIKETIRETQKIKRYIMKNIDLSHILSTSVKTPILTVYSDKYDDLRLELAKHGLIGESCALFYGLGKQYVRIRVSKEKEQIVEILNNVL